MAPPGILEPRKPASRSLLLPLTGRESIDFRKSHKSKLIRPGPENMETLFIRPEYSGPGINHKAMRKFTLIFCSLLMAAMVQAQIIHVPADYPTIQLGIEAATPGDIVLVAEGTYYEQINFLGKKPLTVGSLFLTDGDTTHISNTIIDGSQLTNPDNASVVYFVSGEDTTSVLCGFTIQNGHGTRSPVGVVQGGGIWILNSGARISSNRITGNRCEALFTSTNTGCYGGGIGANSGLSTDWVIIQDNLIDSNFVVSHKGTGYCGGGGIACGTSTRITNNRINSNMAKRAVESTGFYAAGGAIFNTGSTNETLVITGNSITDNQALGNFSIGGAIDCSNVLLNLSHNRIINNHVGSTTTISNLGGGGLVADNCLTGSVIRNNLFQGNTSEEWSGALNFSVTNGTNPIVIIENNYFLENQADASGGAIGINDCRLKLINNVFSHNEANYAGVGYINRVIQIPDEHTAWLVNNTFSFNKTNISSGGLTFLRTNPLIINSIFWQNNAPVYPDITISSGFGEIAYSNIDTTKISGVCYKGPGITNTDPLYNDTTNLVPEHWSPMVDAGIGSYVCMHNTLTFAPLKDITGSWRPKNQLWDMGAYELGHLIHVPADFPTIQAGINAATPGDTVLVDPGTYFENINFLGKKPLLVASQFIMDADTNHIANTIINGSQPLNPDFGSVVTFEMGEDTTSVLCGFTITGGTGTLVPSVNYKMGGGVHIIYSGASLLHNIIRDNTITHDGGALGGGIQSGGPVSAIPWVVMRNNKIMNNKALSSGSGGRGGGFADSYNLIMFNNEILNNEANGPAKCDGGGGEIQGIWGQIQLDIRNNQITHNKAVSLSNFSEYSLSGGLCIADNFSGIVTGNDISYNEIESSGGTWGQGTGVLVQQAIADDFVFENNLITNNTYVGELCIGGGLFLVSSGGRFQNNVILNNQATHGGGVAIVDISGDPPILINNTISENSAISQGGGICLIDNGNAYVINTIIWGNTAPTGASIYTEGGTLEVRYSDVEGDNVWPGEGNVNCDVAFLDDGYHLSNTCQLMEAGIDSILINGALYTCPTYDIDGESRPLDNFPEIGADEVLLPVSVPEPLPVNQSLVIYPNPANDKITVSHPAFTGISSLTIFNVNGEKVVERSVRESEILINISALPGGVYFVQLQNEKMVAVGKMVKK
jgi:hypothetical protein